MLDLSETAFTFRYLRTEMGAWSESWLVNLINTNLTCLARSFHYRDNIMIMLVSDVKKSAERQDDYNGMK